MPAPRIYYLRRAFPHALLRLHARYGVEIPFDRYVELADMFRSNTVPDARLTRLGDLEGWVEVTPGVWACAYYRAKDEVIATFLPPPPPRIYAILKAEEANRVREELRQELHDKLQDRVAKELRLALEPAIRAEVKADVKRQAKVDQELAVRLGFAEAAPPRCSDAEVAALRRDCADAKRRVAWFRRKLAGLRKSEMGRRALVLSRLPRHGSVEEWDAWVEKEERELARREGARVMTDSGESHD